MRKEILGSIIITILLLTSVYFVISSGIQQGDRKDTWYNVSNSGGGLANINRWWNPYTNYSGNTSNIGNQSNVFNISALYFNFTINNSLTTFFGNITNISITIPAFFEFNKTGNASSDGSGGASCTNTTGDSVTPGFFMNATAFRTIVYWNGNNSGLTGINVTSAGAASTDTGSVQWNNCTFWFAVTANGSGYSTTETIGGIFINVSNSSNTGSNTLNFTIGIDSQAPRITNINVTIGDVTQRVINTGSVFLNNNSNMTIRATITDANIFANNSAHLSTGPNRWSNISVWWGNTTAIIRGTATINYTNMTNLSSCTWAEGATGCTFYATLPMLGVLQQEQGNVSFVITAADYFGHYTNASLLGGIVGYNVTFDNTALDCEINLPSERFITYRTFSVSCTGDANETRLYETQSGIEICKDNNGCTGDYSPQQSGILTLECETSDAAKNKKVCQTDITVYSRESMYAGEAAPGAAAEVPTALDISKETATTGLSTGQSTTFRYGTIDHIIKVDSITLDSATISVDSISATIPSGGSKEFDLTGDGTNDIKVTVNKVLLNKADISVEKLAGATIEAPAVVQEEQPKSLTWLWVVLILIVLAVIIYLVISARKNK